MGSAEDAAAFRISVCMRRYFADERARVALLVSARRPVRWLRRRLRALFPLRGRFALLSRGHLLPRDEPLALLDRDDLVEVVPRTEGSPIPSGDAVPASPNDDPEVVDGHVGDAGNVRPSSSETDEPELRDSKRRALEMLERYCGSSVKAPDIAVEASKMVAEPSETVAEPSETVAEPSETVAETSVTIIESSETVYEEPRARRRRVRRRRRRPPSEIILRNASAVCGNLEDRKDRVSPIDAPVTSNELHDTETKALVVFCPVLHNNEVKENRAPRLVRPLNK